MDIAKCVDCKTKEKKLLIKKNEIIILDEKEMKELKEVIDNFV